MSAILVVLGLTAVLWLVQLVNVLTGQWWLISAGGIYARSTEDFLNIFTAPFIHGDFAHLIANTVPLLVLGALAAFSGLGRFLGASLIIIVVSGLGVWFFGPPGVPTVGASGLIFGYFGFLVLRGIVERKTLDLAIMIGVVVIYGGLIFGVLPGEEGISWQAHLFGFIGGLIAAKSLPKRERPVRAGAAPNPYGLR
jgi:membrane associated rhomboid family serine protease